MKWLDSDWLPPAAFALAIVMVSLIMALMVVHKKEDEQEDREPLDWHDSYCVMPANQVTNLDVSLWLGAVLHAPDSLERIEVFYAYPAEDAKFMRKGSYILGRFDDDGDLRIGGGDHPSPLVAASRDRMAELDGRQKDYPYWTNPEHWQRGLEIREECEQSQ